MNRFLKLSHKGNNVKVQQFIAFCTENGYFYALMGKRSSFVDENNVLNPILGLYNFSANFGMRNAEKRKLVVIKVWGDILDMEVARLPPSSLVVS